MVNKITINLKTVANNIKVIKSRLKEGVEFVAVVKANAYGHGIIEIAQHALKNGADSLAVFSAEEAFLLREAGIKSSILMLGSIDEENIKKVIKKEIIITVFSLKLAQKISSIAEESGQDAHIDIKLDTGMNRYGFSAEELIKTYSQILNLSRIKIRGLHSHLADASDKKFTQAQIDSLNKVISGLRSRNITIPEIHLAATEGTLRYPEAQFDAVRIGIGLYGYYDYKTAEDDLKPPLSLTSQIIKIEPVLSLSTKIAQLKNISIGDSVSYKRTFTAKEDMQIAVIPIGYADGIPRALSNIGEVLVKGKRAKIIGRICMNATVIDVTEIECREGDEVVLIGRSGDDKISANDIAELINTNPHEILTGLSKDLPRGYVG